MTYARLRLGDSFCPPQIFLEQTVHLTRKELPNLGSNSWASLPGSYSLTISLLLEGMNEPGREDHEIDPRLGNFFLVRWKKK